MRRQGPMRQISPRFRARLALLLAAFSLASCASFKNVDIPPRNIVQEMARDKELKSFSKVLVRWRNYPFKTYAQSIGYTDAEKEKIKPVNVEYKDYSRFKGRVLKIFKESGLYDAENGTGTLRVDLLTFGRWTYSELFSSYLTDTSWIYILPSSIKVNYYMVTEIEQGELSAKVEETASVKTTFHLLLFPIYPLASFSGGEKSLIKQMLWKTAADVYLKQKGLNDASQGKQEEKLPPQPPLPPQEYKQDY